MTSQMDEIIQDDLSACPTFSSYSSDKLAEIATRVTGEFMTPSDFTLDNLSVLREDDDEDDFEFSLVRDPDDDPRVFYDGQTPPIFPIFNRQQVDGQVIDAKQSPSSDVVDDQAEILIPLRSLLIHEREECCDPPSSSSSSESDDLGRIPPGTYCVWRPTKIESSPSWSKKKSNSTGSGSSKRWKLLDLLRRSNSDGKDSYVFLTPKHTTTTKIDDDNQRPPYYKFKQTCVSAGSKADKKSKSKGVVVASPSSAHEEFYIQNRAIKQGDKKRSYLPYRQDLVGFFANVNALGRTFPPF